MVTASGGMQQRLAGSWVFCIFRGYSLRRLRLGQPELLFCMNKAAVMIGMLGLAGSVALLFSGCSRAESQTSAEAQPQPTAFPVFTNSNMDNFKKPSTPELKQKLTSTQFDVTQHAATEPA